MDYSDRKADPAYMAMSYRSNGGYAPPVPVPMEEETGCCKFSNQFYLMTSFGGTLSCVIIFQVNYKNERRFLTKLDGVIFILTKIPFPLSEVILSYTQYHVRQRKHNY